MGFASSPEPFGFAQGRLREGNPRMRFCRTRPWRPSGSLVAFGRIPHEGLAFLDCLADRDP